MFGQTSLRGVIELVENIQRQVNLTQEQIAKAVDLIESQDKQIESLEGDFSILKIEIDNLKEQKKDLKENLLSMVNTYGAERVQEEFINIL